MKNPKQLTTKQLLSMGFIFSSITLVLGALSGTLGTNVAYADFDDNIGGQLGAPGHTGEPGLEPKADGMNGCPTEGKGSVGPIFSGFKCLFQPNGL